MKQYDHQLSGPLSRRGIATMFALAVPTTITTSTWIALKDHWCDKLRIRARLRGISWEPATGWATVTVDVPTERIETVLLQVLEATPVRPYGPERG